MNIEQLESKGVNPIELMRKTNISSMLVDVIGILEDSIEDDLRKAGIYKYKQKKDLNALRKASIALSDSTYKEVDSDKVYLDYLDDVSYLKDVIMLVAEKKNHVQVLSCLKMIK